MVTRHLQARFVPEVDDPLLLLRLASGFIVSYRASKTYKTQSSDGDGDGSDEIAKQLEEEKDIEGGEGRDFRLFILYGGLLRFRVSLFTFSFTSDCNSFLAD